MLSVILGILILIYLYISLSFIFSKNHKRDINSESISPRVLLSGGGNEPGWNFRIIGEDINKGEVSINLITSYGEHNWGGILGKTWQENYAQNFQYRGDIHE